MFNSQEIRNTILDITPICDDAISIIMDMVKPHRFEVGKYYKMKYENTYNTYADYTYSNYLYVKIEKKTKYFLYYSTTNRKIDKPTGKDYLIKKKLRYDKEDNEYIYVGYKYVRSYYYKDDVYVYSKDDIELK